MPRAAAWLISSMPSPPDCDRNATLPSTGGVGANVAFIRTAGAVFTTPRQFGPITRMPLARAFATIARCERGAFGAHLGEPDGEDHQRAHLLRGALLHDIEHVRGRPHDDREIDRSGNVEHRRVGRTARDRRRVRIDRVHDARETVAEEVPQHLVADLARLPARADHRDRARREQPRDRRRLPRRARDLRSQRSTPTLGSIENRVRTVPPSK